jgi:hypothetical protein
MALTFTKLFQPQQLPLAVTTIFTMPLLPTSTALKNGRVRLTNTTVGAISATLYAVPSGGTAGAANLFLSGTAISPNGYLDIDIPDLAYGDTLQGFASAAASITIHELGGVMYS